jgi:Fic family protein
MVPNNYRGMLRLLEHTNRPLALHDLLEIHSVLGEDALDASDGEGRLRTEADNVRVEDAVTGETWFTPPPTSHLPPRSSRAAMLDFANAETDKPFLHPLLRAIILHFWLAYLHPFV